MKSAWMVLRSPESPAEWEVYYFCRWQWLRAPWGLPRGSERDPADSAAIHRALFETEAKEPSIRAVGCVLLRDEDGATARVRFVATDPALRRAGLGRQLMEALETVATAAGTTQVILHARAEAVPFYERLGYRIRETLPPTVANIPHFLMGKVW